MAYRALDMHQKRRAINIKAFQKERLPYLKSEEIPTLDAKQIAIFEQRNYERFVKEVLIDLHEEGKREEVEKVFAHVLKRSLWAKEHLGVLGSV